MNASLLISHLLVAALGWAVRHYGTPALPGPGPVPVTPDKPTVPILPAIVVNTGHPLLDKVLTGLVQQAEAELEHAAQDALARLYPPKVMPAPAKPS